MSFIVIANNKNLFEKNPCLNREDLRVLELQILKN